MARLLNIGLIQMEMSIDITANKAKAISLITQAAKQGAEIICLPELFSTPYFCTMPSVSKDYTETIPGTTTEQLSQIAKDLGVTIIGGSIFERSSNGNFNTCPVFDETGVLLGCYRKTHIPQDEGFYEKDYFKPGDSGFKVFETSKAKVAVLICYDQWFPEAARACALLGAEIIFYPTAIGNVQDIEQKEGDWQQAWENVQRGHAIANGTIVAAVNRSGTQDKTSFWGGSFICDAFGKILVKAGQEEEIIVQKVDLDHGKFVKQSWGFLHNRRPETYKALSKP